MKKLKKEMEQKSEEFEVFRGEKFSIELYSHDKKLKVINAVSKKDNSILQYDHKSGELCFWNSDNSDSDPFVYHSDKAITSNLVQLKNFLIEEGEEPETVQEALNKATDLMVRT